MGKGDIKTKRGKIINRSYGVRRKKNLKAPTKATIHQAVTVTEEKAKAVKAVKPKAHKEPEIEKEVITAAEIKEPKAVKEHKASKEPKEPKEHKETKSPKKKTE